MALEKTPLCYQDFEWGSVAGYLIIAKLRIGFTHHPYKISRGVIKAFS